MFSSYKTKIIQIIFIPQKDLSGIATIISPKISPKTFEKNGSKYQRVQIQKINKSRV